MKQKFTPTKLSHYTIWREREREKENVHMCISMVGGEKDENERDIVDRRMGRIKGN